MNPETIAYEAIVENDFYQAYSRFLATAGLNGVTVALFMEQAKRWFRLGHEYGVRMIAQSLQRYDEALRNFGGHKVTCPQFKAYPAECICGWEDISRELNT